MSSNTSVELPHVLFVGKLYAGHRTRFLNLRRHTEQDPRIVAEYRSVTGWVDGGLIERTPVLPSGMRGRVRAVVEARSLGRLPRPDVIWTSAAEAAVPSLLPMVGPLRRPVVVDLDQTFDQLNEMAPAYWGRPSRRGAPRTAGRLVESALFRRATLFTPWSRWAAGGLVERGVDPARIRVVPPGVDLEVWRPAPRQDDDGTRPLRLLFVGGDFVRKGGDLLLDVVPGHFAGRVELDVVTHHDVAPTAGVTVHRASPNSPELRGLYAAADLFVLPTRADCFGIACIEAMAAGLPVIMGDVGGARDIVDDGRTGWLIDATTDDLVRALEHALAVREQLPALGRAARATAEERFDGRRNDERIVDLLLEQAGAA